MEKVINGAENIINPEVPETPDEKLRLLRKCLGAIANGCTVEGVTPKHVGPDGALMLNRARRQETRTEL